MADYCTRYSVVLELQDATQQEYALDLAAKAGRHRFEDQPLPTDFPASLEPVLEDWNFETEKDKDGIWLHSDHGGIDAVCAFIQHLLQKFDPEGQLGFEWSHDYTKPRLDAFGGGAAFITAKAIKTMNTADWLRQQTF